MTAIEIGRLLRAGTTGFHDTTVHPFRKYVETILTTAAA